jgi:hypothetical protein
VLQRQPTLRLAGRLLALCALQGAVGCGAHGLNQPPRASASETARDQSVAEREALRTRNLHTRLHPLARELVLSQQREPSWVRDAVVRLPAESCAAAVRAAPSHAAECTLLALDHGAVALLVLREAGCSGDRCAEDSWVFLSAYQAALPLPARRAADYHALRAELPSDAAAVLWLAGFRGTSPTRVASAGELAAPYGAFADNQWGDDETQTGDDALPALAHYASCALAPDQRELLCRSHAGDVLGIDTVSGAQRLVAELGLDARDLDRSDDSLTYAPVTFTADGRLALKVSARHASCGPLPCELEATVAWPVSTPVQPKLSRL